MRKSRQIKIKKILKKNLKPCHKGSIKAHNRWAKVGQMSVKMHKVLAELDQRGPYPTNAGYKKKNK